MPFDMVVHNKMRRYRLCIEVMRRAERVQALTPLIATCDDLLARHNERTC
jgi:xylulose-5-phosphate/fructose-6-phosphate phosphoketolase